VYSSKSIASHFADGFIGSVDSIEMGVRCEDENKKNVSPAPFMTDPFKGLPDRSAGGFISQRTG